MAESDLRLKLLIIEKKLFFLKASVESYRNELTQEDMDYLRKMVNQVLNEEGTIQNLNAEGIKQIEQGIDRLAGLIIGKEGNKLLGALVTLVKIRYKINKSELGRIEKLLKRHSVVEYYVEVRRNINNHVEKEMKELEKEVKKLEPETENEIPVWVCVLTGAILVVAVLSGIV